MRATGLELGNACQQWQLTPTLRHPPPGETRITRRLLGRLPTAVLAKIEPEVTNLADSQFPGGERARRGGTVSLESANHPGYHLHRKNNDVWVEKDEGTAAFGNDAGFYRRAGLADAASGVSFESYGGAGRHLRHYGYLLCTQPADTTLARTDATFYAE
ncbi:AbfB domain-containing protein [Streptomyces sp. RLB1-33]|uniref:AbfB domain-containing protein n=1 Tax=Streptomyces mirabilis TaxID=68239 RepID=UPI002001E0F5|nr:MULTISPECIES: AbfB domain-containing protein [Streptomyces]